MERTTIKQLQSLADQIGYTIGYKCKVFPNSVGTGWDIFAIIEPNKNEMKLLGMRGTITQCYQQLDAAYDFMRAVAKLKNEH